MKKHDTVVLSRALPEHRLQPGDVGTVVHVYKGGDAFEVEFVTGSGRTVAVVTLNSDSLRKVATEEILHVRDIAA